MGKGVEATGYRGDREKKRLRRKGPFGRRRIVTMEADDMRRVKLLLLLVTTVTLVGCSSGGDSGTSNPTATQLGAFQIGIASYYGEEFQGEKTSSGEPFDATKLTAAHLSLAFGTVVAVTNQENGRNVTVRINDRGPKAANRIIDLSKRAASELGMLEKGIATVSLRIISTGS